MIKWMLNIDSVLEYILCGIYCLLLLIIIWLIIVIWNQRKLVNHIVLEHEDWNSMKDKDSKEISQFNSDIQERYESLIEFKEIKFILKDYFIDEIANIIWCYSCELLPYRTIDDFEKKFSFSPFPFDIETSQYGLFASSNFDINGSPMIATNN